MASTRLLYIEGNFKTKLILQLIAGDLLSA